MMTELEKIKTRPKNLAKFQANNTFSICILQELFTNYSWRPRKCASDHLSCLFLTYRHLQTSRASKENASPDPSSYLGSRQGAPLAAPSDAETETAAPQTDGNLGRDNDTLLRKDKY